MEILGGYNIWSVALFAAAVVGMLIVDLYAHRGDREVTVKNAAAWSVVWVGVSLLFAWYIYGAHGSEDASLFLAGYFLEKSLAVDNLFVFAAIFASFAVGINLQHRILYYGILGAIVLRFFFIGAGTSLIVVGDIFSYKDYVLIGFGGIVLYTAWLMWSAMGGDEEDKEDYSDHWSVRYTKRVFNIHPKLVGHNFFTRQNGMLYATPLFLCLVCIEFSDVIFAFDSVPAVIAVTQEPFLIYTSNIFAILGLRSMYFLVEASKKYLCHLEKAVICILIFIGVKMILPITDLLFGYNILNLVGIEHVSANGSLAVVGILLALGILVSIVFPKENDTTKEST